MNLHHKALLGDYEIKLSRFADLDLKFNALIAGDFLQKKDDVRLFCLHKMLFDLIDQVEGPCFLLAAVIDFIDQVQAREIVSVYSFAKFELWLNQFSEVSLQKNLEIRGKIVGKWVPREAYQNLFPIGSGKMHAGSHYVTAHSSPDLDTTVASFWGWMDAFGARVSQGLHFWNVPGGPPKSQVEISFLFDYVLGFSVFSHLTKTRSVLSLSGIDLMTQKGMVKQLLDLPTSSVDHERNQTAVVVVDAKGLFVGDWRSVDVEGTKQIVMQLIQVLRSIESRLTLELASLFGLPVLQSDSFQNKMKEFFSQTLEAFVEQGSSKQKERLDAFLRKILCVENGVNSSFIELAKGFAQLDVVEFFEFIESMIELNNLTLFDQSKNIQESRAVIFAYFSQVIQNLNDAFSAIKKYLNTLDIALKVKKEILGYHPQIVSYRADVEEIKSVMGEHSYLTVTSSDREGQLLPLGIIHASDLQKTILGTVSLRDFCNRDETKIPSYFEVISVIDHHKTVLQTSSAPMIWISDQQSSNSLIAEKAFEINDAFGLGGRTESSIAKEFNELQNQLVTFSDKRRFSRLLSKQQIAEQNQGYFIDSQREFLEYLQFLYAILDDTDLLSKFSYKDVECIASLLNRMKTIAQGKESEIISFDDIKKDSEFSQKAAKRILQNEDMYSLYRKIYALKEQSVETHFRLAVKGEDCNIFADTKEQNGCCRVGQTKMFAKNYPTYASISDEIRGLWYAEAKEAYEKRNEVDLHLHMMSTVPGAEDVYQGKEEGYVHTDEMWVWIPSTEGAVGHLKSFLQAFKHQPAVVKNMIEIEFLGVNAKWLEQIFQESFLSISMKTSTNKKIALPIAVLRYKAGSMNSRKAMISPYLPKIVI